MQRTPTLPDTTTSRPLRTTARWRRLAAVTVVAGVLAGCGGGDDDDSADAPVADASVTPDAGDEPATTGTEEPVEEPADAPMASGESDDWCGLAQQIEDDTFLGDNEIDPFSGGADLLRSAMENALDLAPTVRDRAPDEIADDVDTVFAAIEEMNAVLADADYDLLQVDQAALAAVTTADIEEASANIERYNEEVCGIPASSDDVVDAADVTLPAEAQDMLNDSIVQSLADGWGITDEQAACLVERLDMSDLMGAGDPSTVEPIFEDCGVDPALIGT